MGYYYNKKEWYQFCGTNQQGGEGNIEIIQYDNIIKIIDQEFLQLFSMFIFIKDIMSLRKVIIYFKNVYVDIAIQKQPVR